MGKKAKKAKKGIHFPLDDLKGQEQALQQAKTVAEAKAKEKAAKAAAEDSTGSLAATSALLDDAISGHNIAIRKQEQAAAAVEKAAAVVLKY